MRSRERDDIKAFLAEEAERERLEQEEKERPIREAQAQMDKTARELAKIQKANILSLPDDDLFIAPELAGASMSWESASEFNRVESQKFVDANPDYYPCTENFEQITNYFVRQTTKCDIVNASMWQRAYEKLNALGLIVHRPEPEVIIEPEPTPVPEPRKGHRGYDLSTGQLRDFTDYEVSQLSADEFRRVFSIPGIYGKFVNVATNQEINGDL